MKKVDIGWLEGIDCFKGEVKISQRPVKVTEESERSRREYWSEYWRKRNHITKGCTTW